MLAPVTVTLANPGPARPPEPPQPLMGFSWSPAVDPALVIDMFHRSAAARPSLRSRLERAALIALLRDVRQLKPDRWRVEATRAAWIAEKLYYEVRLPVDGPVWCSCPDFPKAPDGLCKHCLAVGFVVSCAPVAGAAAAD